MIYYLLVLSRYATRNMGERQTTSPVRRFNHPPASQPRPINLRKRIRIVQAARNAGLALLYCFGLCHPIGIHLASNSLISQQTCSRSGKVGCDCVWMWHKGRQTTLFLEKTARVWKISELVVIIIIISYSKLITVNVDMLDLPHWSEKLVNENNNYHAI